MPERNPLLRFPGVSLRLTAGTGQNSTYTPTDVRSVRSFLGLGSYYRRFIPNFARVAEPLQRLVHEDAVFSWGPEQKQSFAALKEALVNATEVGHPRPGEQFIIDCNASLIGLRAALFQKDERGAERPIAFASRVLRANEKRWSITELEAFAVV